MVSVWDNVFGPRILAVWHGASGVAFGADEQAVVSRHMLNDELTTLEDESAFGRMLQGV